MKDLSTLSVLYLQNKDKKLFDVLNRYMEYSSSDMKSVKALCLQMKFIQAYQEKMTEQNYTSHRLSKMNILNERNLEILHPWLTNFDAFDQFYQSEKMISDC